MSSSFSNNIYLFDSYFLIPECKQNKHNSCSNLLQFNVFICKNFIQISIWLRRSMREEWFFNKIISIIFHLKTKKGYLIVESHTTFRIISYYVWYDASHECTISSIILIFQRINFIFLYLMCNRNLKHYLVDHAVFILLCSLSIRCTFPAIRCYSYICSMRFCCCCILSCEFILLVFAV